MKKRLCLFLTLICSLSLISCSDGETSSSTSDGGSNDSVVTQTISSIAMDTLPTKTEYYVGEEFDPTGGVVEVTYSDDSTDDVDLSDDMFTITADTSTANDSATVIVTLTEDRSIRTTFNISVIEVTYDVTFDYNYEDAPDSYVVTVVEGESVERPDDPTRDGYDFDAWYTDPTGGSEYDFSSPVTSDFTLYARWLTAGVQTYTVTFDYNYYGGKVSSQVVRVEEGSTVTAIDEPTRTGYTFSGWYSDSSATSSFDFETPITANTTIYAGWTKDEDSYGEHTYTFEFENCDFDGKIGFGYSGTVTETGMILTDNYGLDASGGYFVGYMGRVSNTLEIYFTSDIDVEEATLTLRISQEIEGYTYDQDNFQIRYNGNSLTYSVTFTDEEVPATNDSVPYAQFKEVEIPITDIRGGSMNLIQVVTSNSDAIANTTMTAHAPLLDCVYVTCEDAVLTWDGTRGLPVENV